MEYSFYKPLYQFSGEVGLSVSTLLSSLLVAGAVLPFMLRKLRALLYEVLVTRVRSSVVKFSWFWTTF